MENKVKKFFDEGDKYRTKSVERSLNKYAAKQRAEKARNFESSVGNVLRFAGKQRNRSVRHGRTFNALGRKKGTYSKKYAAFGGVYGYRKALAQQRRLRYLQEAQNAGLTPEEQQALLQLRARRNMSAQNPENRIIPDTSGYSPLGSYNNEIDDAANLVP